ncbi:MAG: hypothetical protein IKR40_00315 [Treponema sp.]|nr:hypothetical protein [Treponema sp.]
MGFPTDSMIDYASYAEKDAGVRRLIVDTNGEEKTITKKGFEIDVMPVHKFLLQF